LSSGHPRPLAAIWAAVGNPRFDDTARPATSTPQPTWWRALAGIDEPADVPTRNPEQFGDMLNVEHDGGRGHTFPVGSTLDGRLNT
jgi:hypothetical protein